MITKGFKGLDERERISNTGRLQNFHIKVDHNNR